MHAFRVLLGLTLLITGLIGLLIPVMPQWPFIIPGLLILADYFPPARRFVEWAKGRIREDYPNLCARLEKMYPDLFKKSEAAAESSHLRE
jgi:hypothetical protein